MVTVESHLVASSTNPREFGRERSDRSGSIRSVTGSKYDDSAIDLRRKDEISATGSKAAVAAQRPS